MRRGLCEFNKNPHSNAEVLNRVRFKEAAAAAAALI